MLNRAILVGSRIGRSVCGQSAVLTLNVESLEATNNVCRLIAPHFKGGDVIQLIGKVGAGKTAMARCLIRAMLNNSDEVVQSPTFSLALTYQCSLHSQTQLCFWVTFYLHALPPHTRESTMLMLTGDHNLLICKFRCLTSNFRLQSSSAILKELHEIVGDRQAVCFVEWGIEFLPCKDQLCIHIDDFVSVPLLFLVFILHFNCGSGGICPRPCR